jgi:hypothetical protein
LVSPFASQAQVSSFNTVVRQSGLVRKNVTFNKCSYCCTFSGIYNLFVYEDQKVPYMISGQTDKEKLCYEIADGMEFTFSPVTEKNKDLVWR